MGEALFDKVARFYDYEQKEFTKDIRFYVEMAKACGGGVLELACGTGRILLPIAQQGVKITGLDISKEMLNVAKNKIDSDAVAKRNTTLVEGNMRAFDLGKRYALIFVAFRSFQCLLTKKDQVACLKAVHEHLADNGIFVLDLFAPRHDFLAMGKRSVDLGEFYDEDNGLHIKRRAEDTYNLAEQTLHEDRYYEWTDKQGNFQQEVWSLDLAYLFRYEAELLLEKCGFLVDHVYGGFDRSPYDYISGEQIFVARKV